MASILGLAETIQLNNYMTLVVLTAVGYDYILTFPMEVEYIWKQPWTWVSALFLIARYFGLCCLITFCLVGTPFLPGPIEIVFGVHACFEGNTLLICGIWSLWLFMLAADLVMILRVWALYNRSKVILGILLTFYTIDIILYLVDCLILTIRGNFVVATAQVFDFSFCVVQPGFPTLTEVINGLQIALGGLMCMLVIYQFIKHSLQMYKVTKGLQLSQYMNLLVREGMFYFLAILTYALLNMLLTTGSLPITGWWILLVIVQFIPMFTLVPRFILSLRGLYARDLRDSRRYDIDTAFGFTPTSVHESALGTIQFAHTRDAEGLDQDEAIGVEERRNEGTGTEAVISV